MQKWRPNVYWSPIYSSITAEKNNNNKKKIKQKIGFDYILLLIRCIIFHIDVHAYVNV